VLTVLAVIATVLSVAVVMAWLWLRSASPQPPGQHRRPRRAKHQPPEEERDQ
jgi:hypothetical protein